MNYDIVGCGAVVKRIHVPVIELLRERGEITIAGCYDLDPIQARQVAGAVGATRWGKRPEPRENDGVDAALVATPPSAHAEIAGKYIQSGKSVFVEKPLTRTSSEARQLLEAARERGVATAVNQVVRFYPAIEIARRFLRGHLDRVSSIEATDGYRWDWAPASDYVVDDSYGGVIHDIGSYLLDAVLHLLDLDEEFGVASFQINEVTKIPSREPSQDCRARLVLSRPAKQPIGIGIKMSRLNPLPRGIRVHGSFGALYVPVFGQAPILFRGPEALRLRGAEPRDEAGDVFGCCLLAHREFLSQLHDPDVRTRTAADRSLLLTEILEALHESTA